MEYPQIEYLYKYCAFNTNSLAIFMNKKIWVAKPASLNDPFDCKIGFKSDMNPEAFRKYLDRTGRGTGNLQRDYEIFLKGLREFEDRDIRNIGVFCMAETKDNMLMWSHYADQHMGLCIEFSRSSDNLLGNDEVTKPISYCDYMEVDPLDLDGNINRSIFKKMLFSKSPEWRYEKEWRFIYDEGDKEEPLPAHISSIIFGLRMPEVQKDIIKRIFVGQPGIRFQQAVEVKKPISIEYY